MDLQRVQPAVEETEETKRKVANQSQNGCGRSCSRQFPIRVHVRRQLVFRLIGPDLGRFAALGWNTHVKAVSLSEVITGANANPGRNIGNQFIVVGIILLEHADESFGTNDVDALPRCVKENVVALSGATPPSDLITAFGIQANIIQVLADE